MDASDAECWDEMLTMHDDWDQYGANHRRPLAIARARQVYSDLPIKPRWATALADGGVRLDWSNEDCRRYYEVEVHADGFRDGLRTVTDDHGGVCESSVINRPMLGDVRESAAWVMANEAEKG